MAVMKRSQAETRYTWDLTRLFKTEEAFETEFKAVQGLTKEVALLAGTLGDRDGALFAIKQSFELQARFETLYSYAMMRQNEDTQDGAGQARLGRVMNLYGEVMAALAFMDPELLSLPEEKLAAYAKDADFSEYSVMLSEVMRRRAHTLSHEGESLLAMGMEALDTGRNASDMLRDADLRLGKVQTPEGPVELTDAGFLPLLQSPDRGVRRRAFTAMMDGYGRFGNTFAALYAGQVKADVFQAKARKYPSARAMSLFPDQVPEAVYDSLIDAVHGGLGTLNAYLELRRRKVGVARLHMYDLYCGDEEDLDVKPDIEEAFQIFLKAVAPLGEDYVRDASRALPERWIDVYENAGKRSGAYSTGGAHRKPPYVLLNHKNTYDGLSTLCHEMGHAMHTFYSDKAQPYAKSQYAIFVAEVASTTNEILLNEYLRRQYAGNRKAEAALVGNLLEHFRTTVFRQTLFAEFEMRAHAMAEAGESLTRETLSAMYYDIVKTYYGRSCQVDTCIQNEWMRIPHFYSPFYVYKYATGFCAAAALARNILSGDPEKIKSYRRFLTLGGSLPPIEELRIAGVDMESPEAVCSALDYFAELTLLYGELMEEGNA